MDQFGGYSSKTMIGNWWEDRCDPKFDKANTRFQAALEAPKQDRYKSTYDSTIAPRRNQETFNNCTGNWMKFTPGQDTLETTSRATYQSPSKQEPAHRLRHTSLTANRDALEDYRARWTKGNHMFPRTYAGASLQTVHKRNN